MTIYQPQVPVLTKKHAHGKGAVVDKGSLIYYLGKVHTVTRLDYKANKVHLSSQHTIEIVSPEQIHCHWINQTHTN